MHLHSPLLATLLLLAAGLASAPSARAETYQTCNGFIDSVPAIISTQGVWCLRKDVSTAISQGAAITIAANNVTLDCNDFKIGGLGAGEASTAKGIYAYDRVNTTIRRCSVRGFYHGIDLDGIDSDGHLVEDNRLDNNLAYGIHLPSNNRAHNLVRRNRVYDTGGAALVPQVIAISATADIIDNLVNIVFNTTPSTLAIGIEATGNAVEVRGNRITRLAVAYDGTAIGIRMNHTRNLVRDNYIHSYNPINGSGITPTAYCLDNVVHNFSTPAYNCQALPVL